MLKDSLMRVLRKVADKGEIIQQIDKPHDCVIRISGLAYTFVFGGNMCLSVTYREQDTMVVQQYSSGSEQKFFAESVERHGTMYPCLTILTKHSVTYVTGKGIDTTILL